MVDQESSQFDWTKEAEEFERTSHPRRGHYEKMGLSSWSWVPDDPKAELPPWVCRISFSKVTEKVTAPESSESVETSKTEEIRKAVLDLVDKLDRPQESKDREAPQIRVSKNSEVNPGRFPPSPTGIQNVIAEIKIRIENIARPDFRCLFKFQFLTGTRISEVIGQRNSKQYAIAKEDMILEKYDGEDIALFQVHTAKNKGRIRVVALPLLDPWVRDIVALFQTSSPGQIFKVSYPTVNNYAREYFKGLTYLVEAYSLKKDLDLDAPSIHVEEHLRNDVTHFLRHIRSTQLLLKGFDDTDRCIFFGWKPRGMQKRYAFELWLQWSRYVDKIIAMCRSDQNK
jgi:hypothetical protein